MNFYLIRNQREIFMLKIKKLLNLSILTITTIQSHDFNLITVQDLLSQRPDIEYIKCHDIEKFEYHPFPLSEYPELQPHKGLLAETFILKIPHGQVCSVHGWIKVDNNIIHDFILHHYSLDAHINFLNKTPFHNLKKIKGKVAVITLSFDVCFGHWIYNILGRLALLETQNIEYDWLYVAYDKPYMKETLALWGIDPNKIIQPFNENNYIEADELIVPSHIGVRTPEPHQYRLNWIPIELYCKKWGINPEGIKLNLNTMNPKYDKLPPETISIDNYFLHSVPISGLYIGNWLITSFRNKFLPLIQNNSYNFSKRVFISRQDALSRKIINEEEIFNVFEKYGFKKYVLSSLSIKEQIALFHQAETVVATNGSSLTHIIFAQSNTNIIEIFLTRPDSCFYNLSKLAQLNHYCIKTTTFKLIGDTVNIFVNPNILKNFITEHESLFTMEHL